MRSFLDEVSARNTLQTINRQNQRLSQMVNDLLILSRLDRQLSIHSIRDSVVLNDLVSDIAEELAALAIAANLQLRLQIEVSEALEVMGNSEQLYRLVFNLVTNGINYTPDGGDVTIVLESEGNDAAIRVRDTGIGIAKPSVRDKKARNNLQKQTGKEFD